MDVSIRDEIDFSFEEVVQMGEEVEVIGSVVQFAEGIELDEEIDIAGCGIEVLSRSGAEDAEVAYVVGAASLSRFWVMMGCTAIPS